MRFPLNHRLRLAIGVSTTLLAVLLVQVGTAQEPDRLRLRVQVTDAAEQQLLPCRVYVQSASGEYFHVESADAAGSAVPYRVQRSPESIEVHTTVSAHPFQTLLSPGEYRLTIERGKEYIPHSQSVRLVDQNLDLQIQLQRWINMAEQGWYSGETHVHRPLDQLPTAMLADDLNVAFPLVYWVTTAYTPPVQGDKNLPPITPGLIRIDATHVIWSLNTEYEIFRVGQKPHTLGAVFGINHRHPLQPGVPPVRSVAEQVHNEGGLLELDKHNWPWSMMLVPVMKVDLYELSNNHVWRAPFFFRKFGEPAAEYMQIEQDERGFTERGWLQFTWQNYYALLNCGFRLRPTAGTASGVHPVPLGFGRVYVQLSDSFSYDAWVAGLAEGQSFVTTGPMLTAELDGRPHGARVELNEDQTPRTMELKIRAQSLRPLESIEIIAAGRVLTTIKPQNAARETGGFETQISHELDVQNSTWIAVRCWEPQDDGRGRFAHTSPIFVDVKNRPLRPRREEVEYLIARVQKEIERHTGVLEPAALEEYQQALQAYQSLLVDE